MKGWEYQEIEVIRAILKVPNTCSKLKLHIQDALGKAELSL